MMESNRPTNPAYADGAAGMMEILIGMLVARSGHQAEILARGKSFRDALDLAPEQIRRTDQRYLAEYRAGAAELLSSIEHAVEADRPKPRLRA